jgi:hypothetical protein
VLPGEILAARVQDASGQLEADRADVTAVIPLGEVIVWDSHILNTPEGRAGISSM